MARDFETVGIVRLGIDNLSYSEAVKTAEDKKKEKSA